MSILIPFICSHSELNTATNKYIAEDNQHNQNRIYIKVRENKIEGRRKKNTNSVFAENSFFDSISLFHLSSDRGRLSLR